MILLEGILEKNINRPRECEFFFCERLCNLICIRLETGTRGYYPNLFIDGFVTGRIVRRTGIALIRYRLLLYRRASELTESWITEQDSRIDEVV